MLIDFHCCHFNYGLLRPSIKLDPTRPLKTPNTFLPSQIKLCYFTATFSRTTI